MSKKSWVMFLSGYPVVTMLFLYFGCYVGSGYEGIAYLFLMILMLVSSLIFNVIMTFAAIRSDKDNDLEGWFYFIPVFTPLFCGGALAVSFT
ncbi:hypothetical protein ACU6ZS_17655 [Klebsiella aerogenes]